jgi:N,N-dimethylformamidase beta subunit-like, C-terminal
MRDLMERAKTVKCACAGRILLAGTVAAGLALSSVSAIASGFGVELARTAPGVAIAFSQRSYRPGDVARLAVWSKSQPLAVRFFRIGPERRRPRRDDTLIGVPVGASQTVRGPAPRLRIPDGPSGLYFLRATTGSGAVGYAPFVLRPRRPGRSRVLVVLPTNTWQAYNFRDVDRSGLGDTWYDDPAFNGVDPTRPFLDRGVPFRFRQYDLGFLRWLTKRGHRPDFAADDELERQSGKELAKRYDLIVFSGHEEYVNDAAWAATESFRNLGGNIAFLSANNFFYRVERRGGRMYKMGRWRDAGRSEAGLKGVEYVGYYEGRYRNRPYVVTGARSAAWLFAGTALADGRQFGHYGIEVDQRTAESPPGTVVLARIKDIFGAGRSAEMTYYATKSGAKVFSAGVMNFGGSAEWPVVSILLDNLWRRLTRA